MKSFIVLIIALLLLTTGCSSTPTAQIEVDKKPLISDSHLLLSLLNRPTTPDQQLMLAFAKQQDSFVQQAPAFVHAVMIVGEKSEDSVPSFHQSNYYPLIAKDERSIRIGGPN